MDNFDVRSLRAEIDRLKAELSDTKKRLQETFNVGLQCIAERDALKKLADKMADAIENPAESNIIWYAKLRDAAYNYRAALDAARKP